MTFHRMTEAYRLSPMGSTKFLAYDLATRTVGDYPAKILALVRRQKVNDRPVHPVFEPTIYVNWVPNVTCKKSFEV